MRSVIDKVLHIFWDGVNTNVSIGRATKILTGGSAAQQSATTNGEAESEVFITEAAAGDGATVRNSRETDPVREDEREYVIEKLVGQSARKWKCSIVFSRMPTALSRKHTSPPRCYHSPSVTSAGAWFRICDHVPATSDGTSTTHSRTGDGRCSRVTSRKKIAPLEGGRETTTTITATRHWKIN